MVQTATGQVTGSVYNEKKWIGRAGIPRPRPNQEASMVVTAWNNSAHSRNGSGYGFRVHPADRDAFFQQDWKSIVVEVEGQGDPVEIALEGTNLWAEAPGPLPCAAVGRWLRHNGLAPWTQGNPPVFLLEPVEGNRFRVEKAAKRRGL
jgi:hypothetical protein